MDKQSRAKQVASKEQGQSDAIPLALSDVECTVCLCGFENQIVTVPCRHVFCFAYIQRWLRRNETCPLCRTKVSNQMEFLCGDVEEVNESGDEANVDVSDDEEETEDDLYQQVRKDIRELKQPRQKRRRRCQVSAEGLE